MPSTDTVRPVPFDANLRRLEGKKGLVVGIANENSIAYGCARAFRSFGAELAITYLNDKAKPYVEPLAAALEAPIFMPLDVQVEGQLEAVFEEIEQRWGQLDIALHSIAYAPRADLHGRVVDSSLPEAMNPTSASSAPPKAFANARSVAVAASLLSAISTEERRQQRQDLIDMAHPQAGVDALKGAFEGPTEPIPGVADKSEAAAQAQAARSN